MSLKKFEKAQILKDLEAEYKNSWDNQAVHRARWTKLEKYLGGQQIKGNNDVLHGHEWAETPGAGDDVDDEALVVNDLRRVYLSNMQRLTAYSILPKVVPQNKDNKNKISARLGRIFLADLFRRQDEEKLKRKIAHFVGLYGISFLKASFDPTRGRTVATPTRNVFGKVLAWVLNTDNPRKEGDLVIDVLSPRNILLPRFCNDLRKADKVTEVHVVSVDEVYRKFGVVVEAETIRSDESLRFGGNGNDGDKEAAMPGEQPKETEKRVLLKEQVVQPSARYPRGAIFTWCSTQLLRSDELLKHYPRLPYWAAEMIFDDRSVYGDSILWDLIPLQNMMNMSATVMMRWLKLLALMKRWIPKDAKVSEKDLSNASGVNGEYSGDKPPSFEVPPDVPASVYEINNLMRDYMASHGFANELSKVKKAISGNAIGALQEIDDTVMRPALKSIQTALTEACEFILEVAPRYITESRTVKMASMQGWQVEVFRGEMLNGNFHAEINLMTGMPTNKVLRLEFLKGLYKDGLLKKEQVNQYLEFGFDDQALEDMQKENEIAEGVIQQLLDFPAAYVEVIGQAGKRMYVTKVVPYEFENHVLILEKVTMAMRESFTHLNQWVQGALMGQYQYRRDQLAKMMAQQPGGPAGPAGGGPGGGGPPAGTFPGPAEPSAAPDSFQDPSQQPDPDMVPAALSSGFQNS